MSESVGSFVPPRPNTMVLGLATGLATENAEDKRHKDSTREASGIAEAGQGMARSACLAGPTTLFLLLCSLAATSPSFAPSPGATLFPRVAPSTRPEGSAAPVWAWKVIETDGSGTGQLVTVHDLVSTPDSAPSASNSGPGNAFLGRAVVCDEGAAMVVPLWNAAIQDQNFPRWQDMNSDKPVDPEEYRRVCTAGAPFRVWLSYLVAGGEEPDCPEGPGNPPESLKANGKGRESPLRVGGLGVLPRPRTLLAAVNSVQSNFMAPFDFLVAEGRVIRQGYAAEAHSFGTEGVWCWVFALAGGTPRIVSLRVASENGYDRILEQRPALHPARSGAEQPNPEPSGGEVAPASAVARDDAAPPPAMNHDRVSAGVSGLPLLLAGEDVSGSIQHSCGAPARPNAVRCTPPR